LKKLILIFCVTFLYAQEIDIKEGYSDTLPDFYQKLTLKYSKQIDSIKFKSKPISLHLKITIDDEKDAVNLNPFLSKFLYIDRLEIKGSWFPKHRDSIDLLEPIQPESVPYLSDLRLNFRQRNFPSWVTYLKKLRVLHLPNFDSQTINWSIFKSLPELKILKFTNYAPYQMDSLGEQIGYLPSLKVLDIRGSRITKLPSSIIKNNSIQYIIIENTLINKRELIKQHPNISTKLIGMPRGQEETEFSFFPSIGLHASSFNIAHLNLGAMFMLPKSASILLAPFEYLGGQYHSINYTVGFGINGFKQTLGYLNMGFGYFAPIGYSLKAVYYTPYDSSLDSSWGTEFNIMYGITYSLGYLFENKRCYFEIGLLL